MAGANYMGGKRNAAKARTRDAIGRLQKGFFGRRRLEMLSKGLVGQGQEKTLSTSTSKDLEYNPPVVTIDLAHAKRNIQLPLRGKLISTATRHPLHTSVQRESDVSNKTGNAHGGFRSSKVLNALDVSDPLLRRAALDRILSLPDLACLPSRPRHGKRSIPDCQPSSDLKRQKFSNKIHSVSPQLAPCSEEGTICSDRDTVDERQGEQFEFPAGTTAYNDRVDGCMRSSRHSKNKSHDFQPKIDCNTSPAPSKFCWQLSDDDVFPSHRKQLGHHSEILSSLPPSSEQAYSDTSPSGRSRLSSGDVELSEECAISCSVAEYGTTESFSRENLYEYPDPWHTIGVILGLSPASSRNSRYLQAPDHVGVPSASFTATSPSHRAPRKYGDALDEWFEEDAGHSAPCTPCRQFGSQRSDSRSRGSVASLRSPVQTSHGADTLFMSISPRFRESSAHESSPRRSDGRGPSVIERGAGKSDFGTLEPKVIPSPRRSPPRTHVHTVRFGFVSEAVCNMDPEAMCSQPPSPSVVSDPEMVHSESLAVSKTCCDTGPNDASSVTRADGADKAVMSPLLMVKLDVVDGMFQGPCLFTDEDDNTDEE